MRTIEVPKREAVSPESQKLFDSISKKIGFVPNLYAIMGYSSKALKGYLDFSESIESSTFSQQEVQAINLVVSQVNECSYCLAAHTAIGKKVGFSEQEVMAIRRSEVTDPRLKAITNLAREIIKTRGHVASSFLEDFLAQGLKEAALVDLVALVGAKTFANLLNETLKTPIDFPVVKVQLK